MKQFVVALKMNFSIFLFLLGIVVFTACDHASRSKDVSEIQTSEKDLDTLRIEVDTIREDVPQDTVDVDIEPKYESYKESDIPVPMEMEVIQPPPQPDINDLDFPVFNMPPPETEKRMKYILRDVFTNVNTMGDVNRAFTDVLLSAGFTDENGMPDFSYYQVKEEKKFKGFAIITKFEKITRSGDPLKDRFNLDLDNTGKRPFIDYVFPSRLKKGYYRFFAFLIVNDYYGEREANTRGMEEMKIELQMGATELPEIIQKQAVTDKTSLHIFVYEYDQKEDEEDGKPTTLKRIKTVDDHMSRAGILLTNNALKK